jgi:3-deoxy-D-manno-octulosonic-acid transferase
MIILLFIYDIIFIIGLLIYLPLAFRRGKINWRALRSKFSCNLSSSKARDTIWIQAVSVGEVLVLNKIIKLLRQKTSARIVVSTTTLTGKQVADKKYSGKAEVIFFPFDITWVIKHFINKISPVLFIAVETEIWPNLYHRLNQYNIPILILNGRISDSAYLQYKKIIPITKYLLNLTYHIGAQDDFYRQRFLALGADNTRVSVTGNIKFGSLEIDEDKFDKVKQKYQPLKAGVDFLFIAASTHAPEEDNILSIYKNLSSQFKINLLLAPRHPWRASLLKEVVKKYNLTPLLVSQIKEVGVAPKNSVYILDTVGELFYFYGLADICFVGGSLTDYGGHNILEPLYFNKITLFGPHMDNFREIKDIVLGYDAAIEVEDYQDLSRQLYKLCSGNQQKEGIIRNSKKVFQSQAELVDKNIDLILTVLENEKNKTKR